MPFVQPITSPSGTFPYVPNTRTLTINGVGYDLSADRSWTISTGGTGTVTSVALSATMPTGLTASISGSPITSNGTLGLTITMQSGYSIPLTSKQTQWDSAYTFTSTFPSGTALQLFRINAAGTAYEFFTPTYISGVNASLPLVYTSGTNTISINQSSSGANGYLSSTDWTTFNSKLNNPLTTLGDTIYSNASGAALRLAGNTDATLKFLSQTGDGFGSSAAPVWLEITSTSIGAVPTSRTITINGTSYNLSANRTWSVGTVTSVGLTTTTSGISISSSPVTSSGNLNIEISTASDSTNGLLSSTNWTSFNSRMSNPFSALGQMIYSNAAGAPLVVAPNTSTTKKYLSMTGDGTSGDAPIWDTITASSLGAVPTTRTLTINGTALDLSADRTWSVGTVTSVAALTLGTSGTDLSSSVANGTTTPVITLNVPTASAMARGALSSTDWSTFNSKMSNVFTSLGDIVYSNAAGAPVRRAGNTTTTKMFLSQTGDGTSSAAPVWEAITSTSIGAVPSTRTLTINGTAYDLSADRSWSVGTVTSVGLSSSTSGVTIGSTPVTSSGTITLSIATASGSANGLLSSTDWTAFNGKLNNPFSALGQMIYSNSAGAALVLAPNTTTTKKYLSMTGDGTNGAAPVWDTISGIAGSGTASYVAKFTASSTIGNSLIYDTGVYVAVGHTSPSAMLDVSGSQILRGNQFIGYGSDSEYYIKIGQNRSGNGYAYIDLIGDTTYTGYGARLIRYNTGANANTYFEHQGTGALVYKTVHGAPIQFETGSTYRGQMLSNGRFLWNTSTDDGNLFQINGTTSIASDLTVDTSTLKVDASNNRVGVGTASPQKLGHFSAANGATVIRMENTDTTVTSGETIGKIEFYGNDTTAGVGAVIDANGGGLSGEINIDIWAGTNGNVVGGITAKYTGAINFTPYLSAPSPAAAGDVYYDGTTNKLRCYDGIVWNDLF